MTELIPPGATALLPPIISLRDVRLSIPVAAAKVDILRGINLDVGTGETMGILGPSGSGKTSLLMLVAGLERATGGAITVAGTNLGGLDEDARAQFRLANLGIVFQSFHLIPTMTAVENVAIPLELAGRGDAAVVAAEALRHVGLGHRLMHRPAQLSGGEQQRVALARAFASGPRILLADEPTGNLDSETGKRVMDMLFDLCGQTGTTLLLITHDAALAARCSRRVTMTNGVLA
ncbi:ABC transporter ATP-binding protein [Acidisoma cellulosilytica]|uniref:ABC transporter ATP-binding protein n=1 Tax=Acidisoma cellulosilyticum TaxID=2802395 RepID=A0A964E5P9_9PROT|nr:ABC transporter ATP-binding protein [Acidisoma cellulosilyticum]MCB8882662.1 ABC transporter ATP-binding protein [Acidisoma cellulosilyticum]